MGNKVSRKPLGNFFIKKSLQMRLIVKIVLSAVIATLISFISLILVYYLKYNTVIVYQLDKVTQDLTREHIIFLILPTLLISFLVSAIVAIGVGMYASRKYAVPIYKLEQWTKLLNQGNINANLHFREKEEMRELSDECNKFAMNLREVITKMKASTAQLREEGVKSQAIDTLEKLTQSYNTEATPIDVNTVMYNIEKK